MADQIPRPPVCFAGRDDQLAIVQFDQPRRDVIHRVVAMHDDVLHFDIRRHQQLLGGEEGKDEAESSLLYRFHSQKKFTPTPPHPHSARKTSPD